MLRPWFLSAASVLSLPLTSACEESMELPANAELADEPGFELRTIVAGGPYTTVNKSSPARVEVSNASGKVATFTLYARTVTLAGPTRTFEETNAINGSSYFVTHGTWVRTLPNPFTNFNSTTEAWLTSALENNNAGKADVLALAMQFIEGAATVNEITWTPSGQAIIQKVGGDADYGPLVNGVRQSGSDFNDYLGISWTYGAMVDPPESSEIEALDCSGFVRMVYGYRKQWATHGSYGKVPLTWDPNGVAIPRQSFEIYDSAPGIKVISHVKDTQASITPLAIGDLVFFDAEGDAADQIDHVGIFLGSSNTGLYRFISSRASINGPTFGDYNGKSVLNCADPGACLYTRSFRAARRF